ncbi:tryptophan-rich sensory protein [Lapillicoccus jejuensis]|uniref:TspO/MBR related protein n=1 Tax=Lapillicoccus jejuensis TaxID=402171 RepID=A0A542E348_9MICO|nr:tryptophan-rich sensory protein [Lapillicoccus jejuensis]TQJ09753.1 hypothetical protein FB458_2867 [Lapillicoccus jejuensis]
MLSDQATSVPAATSSRPTTTDRVRQVVVTVSEVLCVYGTLVGVGVLGTSVETSSGGALSAEATRIAPPGPAFSIWSVVYLGLFLYTIWQWLPSQATQRRMRSTGWLAAVSMLLNAGWLLVTQQGWIWVSVVVILALVLVLGELVRRLTAIPPTASPATSRGRRLAELVVVDGTFGLYLGWVAVATAANVTAALVSSGVRPSDAVSDLLAVVVIAVVALISVVVSRAFGGRYAVAAASAWGLAWIAVGRTTSEPASTVTAVAAVLAALVVVAAALRFHRRAGTDGADGTDGTSASTGTTSGRVRGRTVTA